MFSFSEERRFIMRTPKQYDLSELNSFFNEVITPDQLVSELVDLLFDYALSFDEDNAKAFKKGVDTIYILYHELTKIKE